MPAQPCANHPKEMTFVRCGRCDKPICVKCMVDSPVGKKCRECAANKTHITQSTPLDAVLGLVVGTVAAAVSGWIMAQVGFFLLAFIYGAIVGEAVLRAGHRRRSLTMQIVAGASAIGGGFIGKAVIMQGSKVLDEAGEAFLAPGLHWDLALQPEWLVLVGIGAAMAVSRVRFL
jgi:hypothetical protein